MGASWKAITIIGCKVTGKLTRIVSVRGCEHPLIVQNSKFCAECGKPMHVDEEQNIDDFNDSDMLGTLNICSSTDNEEMFAGIRIGSHTDRDDKPECGRIDDFDAMKKRVRSELEPLGLWDEEWFGVWTVLHCSY